MKLYTVVIHYLQMCMKDYGCCPKFERGDNSIYTLFHKSPISRLGGVALKSYTIPLFVKI
jgi:hypothetical protein